MTEEITRREALTAASVFGGAAAIGYLARDATQDERAMLGGGGGPVGVESLRIAAGERYAISQLNWYGGIIWEESGELLLDDGDSIGLVEHNG